MRQRWSISMAAAIGCTLTLAFGGEDPAVPQATIETPAAVEPESVEESSARLLRELDALLNELARVRREREQLLELEAAPPPAPAAPAVPPLAPPPVTAHRPPPEIVRDRGEKAVADLLATPRLRWLYGIAWP